MNHTGTKQIESRKLLLRRFTNSDAEAMYKNWASNPEVTKFMPWPPHENEEISARTLNEWIDQYGKPDYYQWAIVLKEYSSQPVGSIGVVYQEEKTELVQIGYCLGKKWWNMGIMSEALELVINFFFKKVNVNRVEAKFDPRNAGSGRVMEKCNMIYEGTLRQSGYNNQGICDFSYYAILKTDLRRNMSR